jgi:hypothetical protein
MSKKQGMKKPLRSWTILLNEQNIRARIEKEEPGMLKFLDFLASKEKVPMQAGLVGWSVFTHWLSCAYKYLKHRPSDVPYYSDNAVLDVVFPASKR